MLEIPLENIEQHIEQLVRASLGTPWSRVDPFDTEKQKGPETGYTLLIRKTVQNVFKSLAEALVSEDDWFYLMDSDLVCFTDAFEAKRFQEKLEARVHGKAEEPVSDVKILADSIRRVLRYDDEAPGAAEEIYLRADNAAKRLSSWGPEKAREFFGSIKKHIHSFAKEESKEDSRVHDAAFDLYCLMCRKYHLPFQHFAELYEVSEPMAVQKKYAAAMLRYSRAEAGLSVSGMGKITDFAYAGFRKGRYCGLYARLAEYGPKLVVYAALKDEERFGKTLRFIAWGDEDEDAVRSVVKEVCSLLDMPCPKEEERCLRHGSRVAVRRSGNHPAFLSSKLRSAIVSYASTYGLAFDGDLDAMFSLVKKAGEGGLESEEKRKALYTSLCSVFAGWGEGHAKQISRLILGYFGPDRRNLRAEEDLRLDDARLLMYRYLIAEKAGAYLPGGSRLPGGCSSALEERVRSILSGVELNVPVYQINAAAKRVVLFAGFVMKVERGLYGMSFGGHLALSSGIRSEVESLDRFNDSMPYKEYDLCGVSGAVYAAVCEELGLVPCVR